MHIIKFNLSGKFAFFKNPEVNNNGYFTYNNIHKIALLGIMGSILGLKGYNQQGKDDVYPEFYEVLQNLKIAIVPKRDLCPNKKMQVFNNSTMFHNKGKSGYGENLVVWEEWIEDPCWEIYLQINDDCSVEQELSDRLLNRRFVYTPYLGKNDHFANIDNVFKLDDFNILNSFETIKLDSFYQAKEFKINDTYNPHSDDEDEDDTDDMIIYKEFLPIKLKQETNHYILSQLSYTRKKLSTLGSTPVFNIGDKNIVFI